MNLILIKSARLKDLTGKVSKSQKGLQNPWWLCVSKTCFDFSETKLVIWRKLILRNPEKSGFGNDLPHLTQLTVEEAPTHLVTGSVSRTAGPPIDQWNASVLLNYRPGLCVVSAGTRAFNSSTRAPVRDRACLAFCGLGKSWRM